MKDKSLEGFILNTRETTILIVEPDLDTQRVYRQRLIHDPGIRLIGICSSMESATSLLLQTRCDILLTELNLGQRDGLELIHQAHTEYHIPNIAVISNRSSPKDILAAIENGAIGYIVKTETNLQSIADYVRSIIIGGSPISPIAGRVIVKTLQNRIENEQVSEIQGMHSGSVQNPLSPRETEVLHLLGRGMSFADISKVLGISTHTVTAHIKKIYRKLKVHSRGEAVYLASQMGILSDR